MILIKLQFIEAMVREGREKEGGGGQRTRKNLQGIKLQKC